MSFRPARLLAVACLLLCVGAAMAAPITGTVTNRTKNKPAADDDVVLIRLAQGMQEAGRTKTDARGHFSIDVPDQGFHLLRVTHDKANYFHPVQPGNDVVDIDVFNAAAHVTGVAAEADVMRVQTDETGKTLRILENFFVKNDSSPPMTQFSDRAFEFYLPQGAVIEGSAALSPGGMPVQASPVPLGDENHFAFIFPIRPGETRFQITYHIPYPGKLTLGPRPVLATDTVAIMMPKSMQFQAQPSAPYSPISDEVNAQTFVARNVTPAQALGFTLTGSGQLPRDTAAPSADGGQAAGSGGQETAANGQPDQTKFGGGLGNPVDPGATNDPWAKYRWWILGGLGLTLATGAGVLLRRQPADGTPGTPTSAVATMRGPSGNRTTSGESVLDVLKEEMFELESDRLRGRISEASYREEKLALETVLRRALRREDGASGSTEAAATADLSRTGSL